MVTFICFPPPGTQNLLSPREDTSRTGEAKLNLVRLRTFRLREIVFELTAKRYNFERGFFFYLINPSPTLSLGEELCIIFYKYVILSKAKYLKLFLLRFTPHLNPQPYGTQLQTYSLAPFPLKNYGKYINIFLAESSGT